MSHNGGGSQFFTVHFFFSISFIATIYIFPGFLPRSDTPLVSLRHISQARCGCVLFLDRQVNEFSVDMILERGGWGVCNLFLLKYPYLSAVNFHSDLLTSRCILFSIHITTLLTWLLIRLVT